MINSRQHLVFYISHLNYGGAEKALLSLIPHLTSFYAITIVTDICDSSLYNHFRTYESNSLELVHAPYPFSGNIFIRLLNLLFIFISICFTRRVDFFIPLFLSNSYPLFIFKLFSRKTKIIIWEHTLVSKHYSANYPLLGMFMFADRILMPSFICQSDLLSLYPYLKSKLYIIPNPCTLDLSSLTPDNIIFSSQPASDRTLNLVVIGRLSAEKNVAKSIYCLKRLLDLDYSTTLEIYGSGDELLSLTDLISSLELTSYVKIIGFSNNCWKQVKPDSIVLITSDYESFSMVALEALCLGHYVVSTPDASSRLFEDNRKFFVSQSSSVSDICSAVLKVHQMTSRKYTLDYELMNEFSPYNITSAFIQALS